MHQNDQLEPQSDSGKALEVLERLESLLRPLEGLLLRVAEALETGSLSSFGDSLPRP